MRWYILLALVVIVTLLIIQESEGWGRRRRGGWRRVVRRPRIRVRTRRLRRAVRVRTRRLRRAVRVRTRRLRRSIRFRTRRLRRSIRFRTRRLRRSIRFRTRRLRRSIRFRTRRLRRSIRFRTRRLRRSIRFRTRRLRRSIRFRTRRLRRSIRIRTRRLRRSIRFRTRKLIRIRTRRILKKFKIKKLKSKVKKLLKKVKKILPLKKTKWLPLIKNWLKGKFIPGYALLKDWVSKLKGLIKKPQPPQPPEPPEPTEEGTSGPGIQPTAPPQPPTEDPFLVVQQGTFTFEAEGDDNSSSSYFSRRLHVFGNTSGVTVGRGYDLKDKMILQIKRDFSIAGIQNSFALKLMNAIHLEGDRAKLWIKNNNLESFTITTQQQKKLFELEYPRKLNKARITVEKYSKTGLKFDQMNQIVKDVIVDIFYRGDYSMSDLDPAKKESSLIMQEYFDQSQTSLKPMTIFMLEEEDFWIKAVGVDRGRYTIRANYMADACEKDKNCRGS